MDDVSTKVCIACELPFPATPEYFHRRKTSPDGLTHQCKKCVSIMGKKRWVKNRDKLLEVGRLRASAYYYANREAILAETRTRRQANPGSRCEESRNYSERMKRENPVWWRAKRRADSANRRAAKRQAQGRFTAQDVEQQFTAQKGKCWWCTNPLETEGKNRFHVDHRIPLAKGGTNAPENICCACPLCNLSKFSKMPWEFNGRLL